MGPLKGYDMPLRLRFVPQIEWWCVGEKAEVESLLACCSYLGKKAAQGHGLVKSWDVAECAEDWGLFYPCDIAGEVRPSRALEMAKWPELAGQLCDCMLTVP
jgi:hypothetical protein